MTGFLYFTPNGTEEQNVTLPVRWSAVPPEAEYRIGISLDAVQDQARVCAVQGEVAMHLFGVPPDSCPPGTYSKVAAAPAEAQAQQSDVGADGSINLALLANGTALDLSSQMSSGMREYGAQVAAGVSSATLCIRRNVNLTHIDVLDERGSSLDTNFEDSEMLCGCGDVLSR